MRPSIGQGFAESRRLSAIEAFLDALVKERDLSRWGAMIQRRTRVVTCLEYVSTKNCWHLMKAPTNKSTAVCPGEEISRSYIIQFKDEDTNEWMDHLSVRKSTLPGAGYGLFSVGPIKAMDVIGMFYGRVVEREYGDTGTRYCMAVNWNFGKGVKKEILVDPINGRSSFPEHDSPAYFAIHMANDPHWIDDGDGRGTGGKGRVTRMSTRGGGGPQVNVRVYAENLQAVAIADIEPGEEIFLSYNKMDTTT